MKSFSRFALILLLLLIGVLLGAWTYLSMRYGSVEDYLAGDDSPRYWKPAAGLPDEETEDNSAQDSETPGERATREARERAEEAGKDDWRAVKPASSEAKTPEPTSTVEAVQDDEFTGLGVEVGDKRYSFDGTSTISGPFFVRTRPSDLADRTGYLDRRAIAAMETLGLFRAKLTSQQRKDGAFWASGRVIDKVKRNPVANAVVALQGSGASATKRAVTNEQGEFALWVGENVHDSTVATRKPLTLAVYADGLKADVPAGDSYSQLIEPDTNGMYVVKLERSKGLRVRVRLSDPAPLGANLRIWCEQLNDAAGTLYDDNMFMSVEAPVQGDVVFRLPGPMSGKIRIGAAGDGWASREVLETTKAPGEVISTTLTLELCSTFNVQGSISYEMTFAGERGASGGPLHGVRLDGLDPRGLTYSDASGQFSIWLPASGERDDETLTVSHASGIREVLYLVAGTESASKWAKLASNSIAPFGPWEFTFVRDVPLLLILPEADEELWSNPKLDLYTYDESFTVVGPASKIKPDKRQFTGAGSWRASDYYLALGTDATDADTLKSEASATYRMSSMFRYDAQRTRRNIDAPLSLVRPFAAMLERVR